MEKYSIDNFNRTQKDVELFSFRFEKYKLTKQLPFEEFDEEIKSINITDLEAIVNFHYFRLGNGIPVLTQNSYELTDDLSIIKEQVPNLIVDYPGSILHTLYNQQFVALRRYRINEAEVDM